MTPTDDTIRELRVLLEKATPRLNERPERTATVWLRIDLGNGPEWIAVARVGR